MNAVSTVSEGARSVDEEGSNSFIAFIGRQNDRGRSEDHRIEVPLELTDL